MTLEELQRRFRELTATVSPEEYLFAEDRAEFDRLRTSRIATRLALAYAAGLAILTLVCYAAGINIIGPGDASILHNAKMVVPDASQWADDRARLQLQADARVTSLLRKLHDAPDPREVDQWISRFSNQAPPLARATRDDALVQLAISLKRFPSSSWPAIIDHLVSVAVLLFAPATLDAVREFAELPLVERTDIVDMAKVQRGLRQALQEVRAEIERMNNNLQQDLIQAQRTRSLLKRNWDAASAARQQCSALAHQTAACLGAILSK